MKKSKLPSRSSLRHAFTSIIWPRRKLILIGLILILINRLCGLVMPGATKYLVDDVIANGDRELLWKLVTIVGIAVAIQAVTSFGLTRLLSVEAQHLISRLRAQVQKHVLRLPLSHFDNTKSGVLVSRIMNDVEGVRNLVGTGLVQLIGGVLTAGVSFFILISLNFKLTMVALIPLGMFAVISMKAFKFLRPKFRKRGEIQADVTGRLTETLGGIRVVKGFNAEDREEAVFEDGVNRLFLNVKTTLTTTSLVTSLATLLMGVASVALMGLGGSLIIDKTLTLGDFFAFTLYLGFLVTPILQMANVGTQITEAFAGLDRMDELLSVPREGDNPNRTGKLGPITGEIRFEHVSFEYDENKPVLLDINFVAKPGSVTALVGSSGSGKTTLAGLAASFLEPLRGQVLVDGTDLSKVVLDTYRSQLGLVLQDDFLFEGTIRENILFARPESSEAELLAACAAAHVIEFTDRFDEGLSTVIGERGVKLSGGQRQRVAIARAVLSNPRVLVLDEATSNLDTESEAFIQDSLEYLMEGRTTFVIAHRLSTIRRADQILVVESGNIVERGTHDELIAAEGRYHRLYTYQARI